MRRFAMVVLVAALFFAAIAPASAGGWALVELAAPVEGVVVGKPVEIQLRVLPHGIADQGMVVGTQAISIVAVNVESGKEIRAQALPDKVSQTYRATITFPEPGMWKWSATDGGYVVTTPLPAIAVSAVAGETAGEAAQSPAVVKISVRDGSFVLPSTPIHVGDTIEWTNVGSLSHVVMSSDRRFEDVPLLHPGDTYRTTASVAGTFSIFCTPHQGMVANLVIAEE